MRSLSQRARAPRTFTRALFFTSGSAIIACSVEDRPLVEQFDPLGAGGSQTSAPPPPAMGGGGGSSPVMGSELAQGALCRAGVDRCAGGMACSPTQMAQVSRCCAACGANEVCNASGACTARPRAQGEVCSAAAPCAGVLFCKAAADAQNRCCGQDCGAGHLCSVTGSTCEPLEDGLACTASGDCKSGYCDVDEALCSANPCPGATGGKFCGRGAQCDAAAACVFTGRGMVSAGAAHTCAVLSTGAVRCWGDNGDGQLGALVGIQPFIGDAANEISLPQNQVTFGQGANGRPRRAVQVSAGVGHTCALLNDGAVRCWGANDVNQLLPTNGAGDIDLPSSAAKIDAGGGHSCALLDNGTVACWGFNASGQLGLGNVDPLTVGPVPVISNLTRVTEVQTGGAHTCAVAADGDLQCWGSGGDGKLGYGSESDRNAPGTNVNVGADVLSVAAGSRTTCAVITGGAVRCWGDNPDGILGYGHLEKIGDTETPDQAARFVDPVAGIILGGNVPLGAGVVDQVEIDTGQGYACARLGSTVRCWGDGADGALGYGNELSIGDNETPAMAGDVQFGAGRTVVALADGARCAVLSDRSIVCWGRNPNGEIGYPGLFPGGTDVITPAGILATFGPVAIE